MSGVLNVFASVFDIPSEALDRSTTCAEEGGEGGNEDKNQVFP